MSWQVVLPYVDKAPCPLKMAQARAMVRHEAECKEEEGRAYGEKLCVLRDVQRRNMDEYNKFRSEMRAARRELLLLLASQNSNSLMRKRVRSQDVTADCEMLCFEGLLTESLGLELLLQFGEGHSREYAVAAAVLEALQCTQEALHATRRRTEEINALRCVEQQQCAKLLAAKERVASRRLEKIRALEKVLRDAEGPRHGSKLLDLLE
ncbi:hypothetical protein C3747_55g113 [Trypanosoma cruzi]|uniref:Uncharacterized protein n=2 Tax=Trypanosoma cruzi TaxID=5693 RepID=Q4DY48_TRYCC|nr:hypothetical protein, conserved [Trypanosoma cruzi]EAN97436.1 hypothetical protein, conserved [Trypanosoma cruzi]KAF5223207.1 hypothetical protein ECC02_003747 [Trypanosoma cruzi]KAF8301595.1 putative pre-mRNA splicing factor [Trypanosoma cruzi]PWV11993.1 hypothetical protein C3747_55g113 [Trypanosoma cruzi]|eukprot:XP_819287.1 hypothetical protein [Trypanosoma cruzi strain CL Brener]